MHKIIPSGKKKATKLFALIILFFLILNAFKGYSQVYAGFNVGYSWGNPASATLGSNHSSIHNTDTVSIVAGSYGKGLPLAVTAGYQFNEHIAAELELEYFFGAGYQFRSTYADSNSYSNYYVTTDNKISDISMFRFNPAFKISTGNHVKIYMRLGVLISVAAKYASEYTFTDNSYGFLTGISSYTTQDISEKYSHGTALGFNGAAGAEYKICNHVQLFGEARFTSLSWAPAHSEVTKNIINGTDEIPLSTTSQLQTDFVNDYTVTFPLDPSSPSKQFKHFVPFNSLGIKLGVVYLFGK